MARRSWPIAANPVSGALTYDAELSTTLLPVSVNHQTNAVTWTGGASRDRWPTSVSLTTGDVGYSAGFVASDSFTRANSASVLGATDTGQSWTATSGTWGISSNSAYNAGGTSSAVATVDAGAVDVSVSAKITGLDNGTAVVARCSDASNFVMVTAPSTGGTLRAYKRIAGTFTEFVMSPATVPFSSGDAVGMTLAGTSGTVYLNGAAVATFTDDSGLTGTRVGIRCDSSTPRFDDFLASA